MYYFDQKTNGFLTDEIHSLAQIKAGGVIPLTDQEYRDLHNGLSEGEVIAVENGKPVLKAAPEPTPDRLWTLARRLRNARLRDCDWTQLPDVPEKTKTDWREYRQALRDLPSKFADDPKAIIWPEKP